jgi:hypothetical protein
MNMIMTPVVASIGSNDKSSAIEDSRMSHNPAAHGHFQQQARFPSSSSPTFSSSGAADYEGCRTGEEIAVQMGGGQIKAVNSQLNMLCHVASGGDMKSIKHHGHDDLFRSNGIMTASKRFKADESATTTHTSNNATNDLLLARLGGKSLPCRAGFPMHKASWWKNKIPTTTTTLTSTTNHRQVSRPASASVVEHYLQPSESAMNKFKRSRGGGGGGFPLPASGSSRRLVSINPPNLSSFQTLWKQQEHIPLSAATANSHDFFPAMNHELQKERFVRKLLLHRRGTLLPVATAVQKTSSSSSSSSPLEDKRSSSPTTKMFEV